MTNVATFWAIRRVDRNYMEPTLYKHQSAAARAVERRSGYEVVSLYASPPPEGVNGDLLALDEIAAERRRQVEVEGWTPDHDDEHWNGELSNAAACYAQRAPYGVEGSTEQDRLPGPPEGWPWEGRWWKTADPRRMLIKAAALIVAEIERLDRAAIAAASTASGEDQASALASRAGEGETHLDTGCVTCGGNGKLWNGLLQEYRPCIDCQVA